MSGIAFVGVVICGNDMDTAARGIIVGGLSVTDVVGPLLMGAKTATAEERRKLTRRRTSGRYVVRHASSGRWIATKPNKPAALDLIHALLPLTDWTADAPHEGPARQLIIDTIIAHEAPQ